MPELQTERRRGWGRRLAVGCGALLALALLAGLALWIWKPWVPEIEVVEPGEGGRRVAIGSNPGNYYPPAPGQAVPGILILGGSEGGLGGGVGSMAQALHREGHAVLQLSYFRAPGQPEDLVRVPFETFLSGLDWLKRQPGVDPQRIAIVGGSKGAEAALLAASMRGDVRAVVAGMPSSVVWPGFSWTGTSVEGSSWTLGGKDVPALPYGEGDFRQGIGSVYVNGLKQAGSHPRAAIPIERSRATVLLVCGEADSLWPSCPMARQLAKRDPRVTVLAYPDAGHGVFGPPVAADKAKGLATLGGSGEGNNRARADSWPKVLAFLERELAGPAPAPAR